ncbi:MAG TPA: ATP-binding protein [Gemmatimonadales bacterium]
MNFGLRILLSIIAILAVAVIGSAIAAERWVRAGLEANLVDEIRRDSELLGAAMPDDPAALQEAAHRFGTMIGRRVTIIDSTGRVLGDSDFDSASVALLDSHATRPEVVAAMGAGVGHARRVSQSTNREELKVAVRHWPGVVRISAPTAQIAAAVEEVQWTMLLGAFLALAFGAALAMLGGRAIARPLGRLAGAAQAIEVGVAPTYPVSTAPEIRQLVRALRSMQDHLARQLADLERGRQEMATLIESMVEGVIAADAGGHVVVCNTATRRLFQYEDGEVLPNLRALFRDVEARTIVDDVMRGQPVMGREIVLDGRNVLVTARPLPTGGAVVCLHDITDVRRLEAVRRDFVANVSHELKTPLTSIAGYAETLAGEPPDAKTARQFAEVILANASRMRGLVDDLLDLSKLESGVWRPQPEPLDVPQVAAAAWAPFAERAAAAGVAFAVDAPAARVRADPDGLQQIFTNLFDNALRHTPAGGRIDVTGTVLGDNVAIAVEDTGGGIPGDQIGRVFERFYRVDPARSRDQGGTGLGLSIVRHLVEAHGGRVELDSTLGVGTKVRFTLRAP